ncbi:hypothetical protein [Pseudomonas brassicacearum]|uniref:Uncharacterized protein n=1 Tax=Pseudomonas brassicacearum subsp. neoaurantiaca TaxID=494916 RepID=A0A7V8UB74_9PSED|nr:hypothetical protein [Pseudomonas brassicacearum]MBA1376403.1 hypothetical protein [Pseudomonas brassicacearum subsp. neoaurantiaca]
MRHLTTLAFAIMCVTAQQTHAEDLDRAREHIGVIGHNSGKRKKPNGRMTRTRRPRSQRLVKNASITSRASVRMPGAGRTSIASATTRVANEWSMKVVKVGERRVTPILLRVEDVG